MVTRKSTTSRSKATKRKTTTRTRSTRSKSVRSAHTASSRGFPAIPEGQKAFIVDLPWGMWFPGIKTIKSHKVTAYIGESLPDALKPYQAKEYSYQRWIQDEINNEHTPVKPSKNVFTPREHQKDAARMMTKYYKDGYRSFLIADSTGIGKTLSCVFGVTCEAASAGFGKNGKLANVLIVCPKGAIPEWRKTLKAFPPVNKTARIMVTNYEQLTKLLIPPASAKSAKQAKTRKIRTAREGKSKYHWDFIIFDEAHYMKNYPKSLVSLAGASVAQLNNVYVKGVTPAVTFSTATPGATPLNLSVEASVIAPQLDTKTGKNVTPQKWGDFLIDHGFSVRKGKNGYNWVSTPGFKKNSSDPAERAKYLESENKTKALQRNDTRRIGKALKNGPFLRRSPVDIAGWPEQQFIPYPLELNTKQQPLYEAAWSRFREWLRKPGARNDPKSALVESLRYRQKSSFIKVESMIDSVCDMVEAGNQVYISCEFLETIEEYQQLLKKRGVSSVEISGRMGDERDNERIKFQKGEASVALCNIVEAISLHAGEDLSDGTKATMNPRITIVHDVRQNPNDSVQLLGRAHRSGQNSLTYVPYFSDTVDETVVSSFVNKYSNMQSMSGEDDAKADELKELFFKAADS